MLLQMQKDQMWEEKKAASERKNALFEEERAKNGRDYMKKTWVGHLRHHKMREKHNNETRMDRFRKMKFTIKDENGTPYPGFEDVSILDTINRCSRRGLYRLYDRVYPCFLDGTITPEQFSAFENLSERREWDLQDDCLQSDRLE